MWLWCLTGVLGAGAVVVLAGVVWLPYERAGNGVVSARAGSARSQGGHTQDAAALPPAGDTVWRTPLRQPLQDQPTPTRPAVASAAPSSLTARLAGTVVEQGHSVAMFITRSGKIEFKAVGEAVDDAEVLDITLDRVSLRHNGRTVDLTLEKKGGM